MTTTKQWPDLPHRLTSLAAFLLVALAVWVPSGYSYGAALLLLGALFYAPRWLKRRPEPATWGLVALLLAMGCMWFALSLDTGAARWDKGSKWLLGVPCLLFVLACPPRPQAFVAGLPIGCVGMGVLGLWQVCGKGMERATGFTNAIQWGNLALLLACFSAVCAVVYWRRHGWPWRAAMLLAVIAGVAASLLSGSRGGWVALLLIYPALLLQVRLVRPRVFGRLLVLSLLSLTVLGAVLVLTPSLDERLDLAVTEVLSYFGARPQADSTSLGIRLDQYRLAAQLIAEKPWLGWGAHGFVQEVHNRVASGEFGAMLVHYPQIHNDLLDVWVKTGLPGLLLQATLYVYVLYIFWPSRRRMQRWADGTPAWHDALALRAMGSLVPLCYLMFGMSQPFFNHNSGIMFFIFYVAVLWAALRGVERAAEVGEAA